MKSTSAKVPINNERPKCVLLAEDNWEFRTFLADLLRADGHLVIEVADGQALLARVASLLTDGNALDGVDLIVSDVRMPHFDALEVAAALRSACVNVPMILMTAFGDSQVHEQAHGIGVLRVLNKPFDIDDLRTAVTSVLNSRLVREAVAVNE